MELKPSPALDAGETLTGAEIGIRGLKEEGVEFVFGYPGGAVLHIYDAIFQQKDVKHILVRHEQGALHAADGYARATGKPGVALVTSGPGVTNAITGIAVMIKKAFHIATTGRPGPVLVDIPKDVSNLPARFHYPDRIALRSYSPVTRGHAGQIKKALQLLVEAK